MYLYGGPKVWQMGGVDLRCDGVEGFLWRYTSGNAQDPCPHQNSIPVERLQGNSCH
jgi:hypothetical protein